MNKISVKKKADPTAPREFLSAEKETTVFTDQRIVILLKEILYNSLSQAIIRIFQTPHKIHRTFLLCCVILTSGLSAYLFIRSLTDYFKYEVATTNRVLFEVPTSFPKVVICHSSPFTTKYAYEFLLQLNKEHIPHMNIFDTTLMSKLNSTQRNELFRQLELLASQHITSEEFPTENKTRLGHSLKDVLMECMFNYQPCSALDFTNTYELIYGNCFVFNSDLSKLAFTPGRWAGLRLKLYANFYSKLSVFNSYFGGMGFVIRVENNTYFTDSTNSDGIKVIFVQ